MNDFRDALTQTPNGTIIAIDVSPSSKREIFPDGYNEWRHSITCSIRAPPVEGKANKAVIALIGEILSIPKSRVHIISGSTSTQKRVLVEGMDIEAVASRLKDFFA
ncbi:MAG TPA: DUF167 domain-containing protein [Methanoregulaceae archaeon]|jgi:hypothetical protein|nr:DUF167 domain-containing protein [Methanoregulaceae archaeon]MDD5684435.1 DUF167 domain-containing protein [Methanoregulaceae archaeon]HQC11841.1 DUF167 domain-containing protein [Methanoregulaceae archaeon]